MFAIFHFKMFINSDLFSPILFRKSFQMYSGSGIHHFKKYFSRFFFNFSTPVEHADTVGVDGVSLLAQWAAGAQSAQGGQGDSGTDQ